MEYKQMNDCQNSCVPQIVDFEGAIQTDKKNDQPTYFVVAGGIICCCALMLCYEAKFFSAVMLRDSVP